MDNFEKRMWISYTLNMMEEFDTDSWPFDQFYYCLRTKLKLKKINTNRKTKSDKKEFLKALESQLQDKLDSIKPKPTMTEDKFLYLKDLYNLDEVEYQYFIYYTLQATNKMFSKLRNCVAESDYDFGIDYLKLKTFETYQKLKSLTEYGIFERERFGNREYNPSRQIMQVFESTTKMQDIQHIMLGESQQSTLEWSDFEYLGKERDIVLKLLKSAIKAKEKGINILLYGSVGTGKTEFAKLVANKAKVKEYSVASEIDGQEATRSGRLHDLFSKQKILTKVKNSCILFDESEDVMNRGFGEMGSASKSYLNIALESTPVPVFWTTNNIRNVDPAFLRRMTYTVEFEKLSEDIRLRIWQKSIKENDLTVDRQKLIELNKNYNLSPSLISNAVKSTKLIGGTQDDFETFVENVARVVTKKKSVKNKKEFEMQDYNDDLVNCDLDIKDLTAKIKSCGKLNFSLCLYGEPGTGKSLYARYLAKQLGVEVIMKRASDLISKWVGETEKNIADAFAEAKSKKAMLIFDEADSFLQNRGNADHSWEITQVNEMLTWMESHEYPFVCTTNLLDSLDEASLRRFTFKVKFDFLTPEQVNEGIEHFFNIPDADTNIKGVTAGDFATVKKKTDFLNITDLAEIVKMLQDEVKIKKSKTLQTTVGF